MDKQTLSNYGWIAICVLVLAVMLAFATPFGSFIKVAIQKTSQGFFDTESNAANMVGMHLSNVAFGASVAPATPISTEVPEGVQLSVSPDAPYFRQYTTCPHATQSLHNKTLYYTGDLICDDCGKVISEGEAVDLRSAKIKSAEVVDYFMITYVKGMTWEQFVDSEYNTNGIIAIRTNPSDGLRYVYTTGGGLAPMLDCTVLAEHCIDDYDSYIYGMSSKGSGLIPVALSGPSVGIGSPTLTISSFVTFHLFTEHYDNGILVNTTPLANIPCTLTKSDNSVSFDGNTNDNGNFTASITASSTYTLIANKSDTETIVWSVVSDETASVTITKISG